MAQDLLKNLYFFKPMSPTDLFKVQQIAHPAHYGPGDTLFTQNDPASALFIIKFGTVRIRHASAGSDNMEVSVVGTGSVIGEMGLLDGAKRSASAEAMEATEVLCIGYTELKALLEQNPPMAVNFYQALAQYLCARLSLTTDHLSFARDKMKKRA